MKNIYGPLKLTYAGKWNTDIEVLLCELNINLLFSIAKILICKRIDSADRILYYGNNFLNAYLLAFVLWPLVNVIIITLPTDETLSSN